MKIELLLRLDENVDPNHISGFSSKTSTGPRATSRGSKSILSPLKVASGSQSATKPRPSNTFPNDACALSTSTSTSIDSKVNAMSTEISSHTASRPRVLSRTQVRHAAAARRLSESEDASGRALLQSDSHSTKTSLLSRTRSSLAKTLDHELSISLLRGSFEKERGFQKWASRPVEDIIEVKPPPLFLKSLEIANVGLMANSTSLETLMDHKAWLNASFMTPMAVLEHINSNDVYYHVWVAVMLALEEMSVSVHGMTEVRNLAFTKLMISLGSALVDCLRPDQPHFTFIDIRNLLVLDGRARALEEALTIAQGLQQKGVDKEKICFSLPATESGIELARTLKFRYGLSSNMLFVSGPMQALSCASIGAASVTIPVDSILAYHEKKCHAGYEDLPLHPGWQSVQTTACAIKLRCPNMHVIAEGPRSFREMEYLTCVDSICLADDQVSPLRSERRRMNRPPKDTSEPMMRAQALSLPATDADHARYMDSMPSEARREAKYAITIGVQEWQHAMLRLDSVIDTAIQRRLDSFNPSPSETCMNSLLMSKITALRGLLDTANDDYDARRARSVSPGPPSSRKRSAVAGKRKSKGPVEVTSSQRNMQVAFPSMDDDFWVPVTGSSTSTVLDLSSTPSAYLAMAMGTSEEPGSSSEED